jgi:hypothetical protein
MLTRFLLMFPVAIPMCGYCQSKAGSPFYRPISAIPATAHVEGWAHGIMKANGVMIDLSVSEPSPSQDSDELHGGLIDSWVDRNKPGHVFHYFRQYNQLNVVFGYDLLVEPVQALMRSGAPSAPSQIPMNCPKTPGAATRTFPLWPFRPI